MLESVTKWLLVGAALLLALSVISNERVRMLHRESALKAEASRKASIAFTADFEERHQDEELKLLDERRVLAGRALRWNVTTSISFALSLLCLLGAWVSRQLTRAAREAEADGQP